MTDVAGQHLSSSRSPSFSLPLALRIAGREFRGGLSGFAIFLACIALGVMAITGVGSLSRSLSDGLARQGHIILGGDLSFDLIQREATPIFLRGPAARHGPHRKREPGPG